MTDLVCRIEENNNNNNNEGYNANDVLLVILRYIILCNIKLSDRHFQFLALLVSSINFFSICHWLLSATMELHPCRQFSSMESQGLARAVAHRTIIIRLSA